MFYSIIPSLLLPNVHLPIFVTKMYRNISVRSATWVIADEEVSLHLFYSPYRGEVTQTSSKKVGVVDQKHVPMGAGDVSLSECWMIIHLPRRSNKLTVSCRFILNPIFCQHKCVASQHVMKQLGFYLIFSHRLPTPGAFSKTSKYMWVIICQSVKAPWLPLSVSPSLCVRLRADTILEDVQVVGGCYGDDVLRWVPSHVQDFLTKVQAINAHISTATLTASIHSPGPQHGPRLATFSPSLQGHAPPCLPVKHPEEAVVSPCHDDAEERIDENNEMSYWEGQVNAIQMAKRGKTRFRVGWGSGKEDQKNGRHWDWFDVCKARPWDWFKCWILTEPLGNHCKQKDTDTCSLLSF